MWSENHRFGIPKMVIQNGPAMASTSIIFSGNVSCLDSVHQARALSGDEKVVLGVPGGRVRWACEARWASGSANPVGSSVARLPEGIRADGIFGTRSLTRTVMVGVADICLNLC